MVKNLSVFFPAYNEEKNVENTVNKALQVLKTLKLATYEIIIVDDGSKDNTGIIADKLAEGNKSISVIHHHPNKGYGEALKSGFYNSKYDWIVFTDSDGQFDFSEISKFLEKAEQGVVVVGYRVNRVDPWFRKLFGWGWTLLANMLLGVNVRDVDCAFKLVSRAAIKKIPQLESSRGGMISPELLAKLKKVGFKIVEVPVHHFERDFGHQTGADLKVIFISFVDLFKLWWKIR